ncbi:ArnT family glycosyltransferase [Nucisporomicrobium flavum]|uniref:ArnT family glycosyltransferase n=1 Tax=Nucisporomicrobium flavum TaxID=2785915 RepID=UPI0018F38C44|nr:glycosyltransferase family 39 protein [Nucisporomicrobium flavum]
MPEALPRRSVAPIGGAVLVAVLLRVPFLFTGLSTDEGGYAYVARQWARGDRLYTDVWLDRPQGLLLTYRALLAINGSGWAVRLGVVLAGAIITVAVAVIAGVLAGRTAGAVAAWIYAVVGVAPHLEGMTLNGELLASVPSTVAIALTVLWWRRGRSLWWLAGAGVLAGVALTMKQSGIDGVLVGVLVLALARRGRAVPVFLAGVAVPLLASALHGLAVGWSAYWTALVGYQLSALGGTGSNTSTRLTDLGRHAGDIALGVVPVLLVSLPGWRVLDRGARWLLGVWLFAGFVGINLGGSYWPHYFVQPLPALVVLAAVTVAGVRAVRWRWALAAVATLPTLVWLAALVPMSPGGRADTIPYDALAARDDRIAAVIRASTGPDDRIYVLESEAYLYFAADREASYPYLWGKPIDKIPDALPRLRAMLASPQRPALVVLDTPPAAVDPSGGIAADLAAHYHPETTVEGVPILRANP